MSKNQRRPKLCHALLLLGAIAMLLSGCVLRSASRSTPTPPASVPGAPEPPGQATAVEATEAQAPASDSTQPPVAKATYTPTVAFIASIVVDQAQVRTGPGEGHPLLATIEGPISVRVIGINTQKTWLFILLPDNRQGWIPVASVEIEFDLDLLPVVKDTPLPPTPYGSSLLVPPQLLGVTPTSPSSPGRLVLSVIALGALALLVLGASTAHSRRARPRQPAHQRLLQILTSLF